jgi:catechol 2,3-dioxygenase-like lactoylglutathione lyase family enzyme
MSPPARGTVIKKWTAVVEGSNLPAKDPTREPVQSGGRTIMPKLRHIAIATNDPKATAEFYKNAFGFEQVGETSPTSPLATGYFLSDGTLNIAVLKFKTDQLGKGVDFTGVHHFGILVDDTEKATAHLESLGAECFMGKENGHGKGFFEIKFKGPDGTVFDIAGHPWQGSKPHDA